MSHSIITALITLLLTVTAVQAVPETYIVGGDEAVVGEFPYFVEMEGCGGALITPDTVLFAAHCGVVTGNQVIISSSHRYTLEGDAHARFCADWVQHPGWVSNQGGLLNWDFALCKLDRPVANLRPGNTLNWEDTPSLDEGDSLIVMGYGFLYEGGARPSNIHKVEVPYVTNQRCSQPDMYGGLITDQMLCAGLEEGGKDACQGDSGGPIVKRGANGVDYHVGVVSFGDGCARASKPGVYARTSEAKDWIEDTLCNRFNSVWCDNYVELPPVECPQAQLDVLVQTDGYAQETSWRLTVEGSNQLIQRRKYSAPNYGNSHSICVDKMECYNFNVTDAFGDGMCVTGDCGFYELRTPGEQPFFQGGTFERFQLTQFCIDNNGRKVDTLPVVVTPEDENDNNNNNGGGHRRRKTGKNAKTGKKAGKKAKKGGRRERNRVLRVNTGNGEAETPQRVYRVRTRESEEKKQ